MHKYKYLFFDIDHTIWDFEANSAATLKEMYDNLELEKSGVPSFNDFDNTYHEINDKMWARFRNGYISREDLRWKRMWKTLLHFEIYNVTLAKEMSEMYLEILPTKNLVFPHAESMLTYCKEKKYEMHLITNGFELTQIQKLKNSGLHSFFDKLITSEKAMSMKPHKEIFEYALTQTGASHHESIMIGDALDIDIAGAMNIGMAQIFFNPKKTSHDAKPTYEINCLSEIMNIL